MKTRASKKPEDIKTCISAGILPKCFEGTAVEIELQEKSTLSCFLRRPDGTVTCPMGNVMGKARERGTNIIYQCRDACRQCPNRCVPGHDHKTVSIGSNTDCIPVMMYGSPRAEFWADSTGCENQSEQSRAGSAGKPGAKGSYPHPGGQGKAEAANVFERAPVRDSEMVSRRTLLIMQRQRKSRSRAGA